MSIVLPILAKFGLLMLQADDVSARFLLYLPATLSVIWAKVCQRQGCIKLKQLR